MSLDVSNDDAVGCEANLTYVKRPGQLLIVALGIGAAWQAFQFGQAPGVGFPLWMAGTLAALCFIARRENVPVRWRNVVPLALGVLFFAGAVAVRANETLTFLNVVAALGLMMLLLRLFAAGELSRLGATELLYAPWWALGHATVGGTRVVQKARESVPDREETVSRALPIVRGLLLTAPILAVFVGLFASADAVFAQQVNRLVNGLLPQDLPDRMGRVIATLFVAWGVTGVFARALTRRDPERRPGEIPNGILAAAFANSLGFTEGIMVLGAVVAVFAAFIAIQFAYLFGGEQHVLHVPNLTYAEYARRGFAELVLAALLSGALVLGLRAVMRTDTPTRVFTFRTGATLLVALTLVLLASAAKRMAAYEVAYGATEMRTYVDTFIFWLGIALMWLARTLWHRHPERSVSFVAGLLACMVGCGATLDLQNTDARVAVANGNRSTTYGRSLDSSYLASGLSEDAIPVLLTLWETSAPENRAALGSALRDDLTRLEADRKQQGWPSFHLSRERAYCLLKARETELPPVSAREFGVN